MKPSFTLVEMLVTIFIIALMAGVSATGYVSYKKRTNFDDSVAQLKDALLDVQNRAFVPESDATDYVFLLNKNSDQPKIFGGEDVNRITVNTHEYSIVKKADNKYYEVSKGKIEGPVSLDFAVNDNYISNNDLLYIYYRAKDGAAGCKDPYYYDSANWSQCQASEAEADKYIQVTLTDTREGQTNSKTIKIQKTTGNVEM